MKPNRGSTILSSTVLLLLVAIVVLLAYPYFGPHAKPKFTTEHQAVLLTNGQVYFGKLEGLGTPYPTLREVYYVQGKVNPETKEVANILVKRGKEWHAPDLMILNPNHIILVEPVGPDSKVAQLIAELRKQN
ncbi:MAG: hypothetical protein HY234_00830 [Acidobacteria bacterium]|nr:hypothetical protein [Acidobacteriota bacterium]